jgi:hypothetical protein
MVTLTGPLARTVQKFNQILIFFHSSEYMQQWAGGLVKPVHKGTRIESIDKVL